MDLFADSITEDVYDAEMADLHFYAYWSGEAYLLSISGYNDKMPLLVEEMTKKLKSFRATPERFEKLVDRVSHYCRRGQYLISNPGTAKLAQQGQVEPLPACQLLVTIRQ